MSILSELKKLTGKKANVISKALPDEFGGSGVAVIGATVDSDGTTVTTILDRTVSEIKELAETNVVLIRYVNDGYNLATSLWLVKYVSKERDRDGDVSYLVGCVLLSLAGGSIAEMAFTADSMDKRPRRGVPR